MNVQKQHSYDDSDGVGLLVLIGWGSRKYSMKSRWGSAKNSMVVTVFYFCIWFIVNYVYFLVLSTWKVQRVLSGIYGLM